ncbi:MAG: response regulator [Anaerolineaceae bacterium]|nr:response regulator [Anaerolineaceae bacterium]
MKHVLIVDDALDLGRLLQSALTTLDIKTKSVVVPSAEEALLEAAHFPIDLLVTDIRLPGLSGTDLVRKMRSLHPDLKVIMITGMTGAEYEQQARDLKVESFFRKPMKTNDFLNAVENLIGSGTAEKRSMGVQIAPAVSAGASGRLVDLLANLRTSLGALTVLVLEGRGQIIARSGEFPDPDFETEWVPRLLAAVRSGIKVSRWMKETFTQNILAFRGKTYHVILSQVSGYALLIVVGASRTDLRLALAFEEAANIQPELEAVLASDENESSANESRPSVKQTKPLPPVHNPETKRKQPEIEPVVEPAPTPMKTTPEELANLLEGSAGRLKPEEVNDFWNTAADQNKVSSDNPDFLTYDQAHKMGLTPKDTDEQNTK